jgi:hypothetical protein
LARYSIVLETRIVDLDIIAARLLDAIARGEPLGSIALTFLLRHYLATGRDDLGPALGDALAAALEQGGAAAGTAVQAGWLILFVEAMALSDDPRLLDAARALVSRLRDDWPSAMQVAEAAASVDACLRAADVEGLLNPQDVVPAAIDQLERIVGGAYQPGGGMAATIHGGTHTRGADADQVRPASALLAAFERSGRLPYSMLAEELIQPSRPASSRSGDTVVTCEAARVLCRLALLHADDAYRGAAVLAEDADYRGDAERILLSQSTPALGGSLEEAAAYGLALGEWLATAGNLQ